MKVGAAVSGATTVPANSYAIVDYKIQSQTNDGVNPLGTGGLQNGSYLNAPLVITRYFGPSQSIPNTFTANWGFGGSLPNAATTYVLMSGVILENTQ